MKAALILAVLLCGCAVQKEWVPTGGSRADATVKMSFEYGGFEVPKVDNERADATARQKCAAWGYTDAQRFEGVERTCLASNQYGCTYFRVTATYQCTGQPEKAK